MEKTTETFQEFTVCQEVLTLLPEKAIYWAERNVLIVADVHLGKAGHFRKAGIPVPTAVHQKDLKVLFQLIDSWKPDEVILLGDLFHSDLNNEWWEFENFLQHFAKIKFILIKGNHDVLPGIVYQQQNLELINDFLEIGPFAFSHIPTDTFEKYNIAGHIHPGISLKVAGGRNLKFPCFYFGEHQAILPAFGQFTGYISMRRKSGDTVFPIIPLMKNSHKVIDWN